MKKQIIILSLILTIPFYLIGCNSKDDSSINTPPSIETPDKPSGDTSSNGSTNDKPEDKPNSEDSNKDIETPKEPDVVQREVRLFYYDVLSDTIQYTNQSIEVKDKAVATAIVNALKSPKIQGVTPALAEGIKIKSAKVDSANSSITIDFSDDFVSLQNLGSGAESGTLRAIANTFGYNFNVNNVIITLNGKPYESGHIIKKPGEGFTPNYDNSIEI